MARKQGSIIPVGAPFARQRRSTTYARKMSQPLDAPLRNRDESALRIAAAVHVKRPVGPPPLPPAAHPARGVPPPLTPRLAPAEGQEPNPFTAPAATAEPEAKPFWAAAAASSPAPLPISAPQPLAQSVGVQPVARPTTPRNLDDLPDFMDGQARGRRVAFTLLAVAILALLTAVGAAIASNLSPR
jgi:hypothetical protein